MRLTRLGAAAVIRHLLVAMIAFGLSHAWHATLLPSGSVVYRATVEGQLFTVTRLIDGECAVILGRVTETPFVPMEVCQL